MMLIRGNAVPKMRKESDGIKKSDGMLNLFFNSKFNVKKLFGPPF